jgi:glycosyltransferase involved in cell wall biosynthesis
MVLEALATLPDLFLAIAGTGPVMAQMQAKSAALGLAGRVRFLGEICRADLPAYYRTADYTLLYSGYEGLSHVLLESLALGTPVIASHKGGNPEVVQDGLNGWLIPFPDVAALREGLAKAFQGDAPQRLRASATLDLSRFAWDGLVAQTLSVLTS